MSDTELNGFRSSLDFVILDRRTVATWLASGHFPVLPLEHRRSRAGCVA